MISALSSGMIRLDLVNPNIHHLLRLRISDGDKWSVLKIEAINEEGETGLVGYFSNSMRRNLTDFAPTGMLDKSDYYEWVDMPHWNLKARLEFIYQNKTIWTSDVKKVSATEGMDESIMFVVPK